MMLQIPQHHRPLAQAVATHGVNVVTTMGHGQGKTNRLLGPILAYNFFKGLQLPGGLKWQIFENAGFIQLVQRQWLQGQFL